ncbi:MAG: hypothetical protein JRL30_07750 [Deltaproteobacteria bacterium]|nr:hypothetical protein [Deltaproteobacteria bacterium]
MASNWWQSRKEELLAVAGQKSPLCVFNEETLNEILFDLLSIEAVDRLFYPVHTHSHPKILRKAFELDVGFVCGLFEEIDSLLEAFPGLVPQRIVFFSDNASDSDLERAFRRGVHVVINHMETLNRGPHIFRNREVFLLRDVGHGQEWKGLTEASVNGFYLCSTRDSPLLRDSDETVACFMEALNQLPHGSTHILGNSRGTGGGQEKRIMDIPTLADFVEAIKDSCPHVHLWLEVPDRMLSCAGVLLARVIETGEEAGTPYIRIHMDMKAPLYDGLHRPPHHIINLSKPDDQESTSMVRIRGLEQDSGNSIDVVKASPPADAGDVLLFTDMGACGTGSNAGDKREHPVPIHYLSARSMCPVDIYKES